MSVNIDPIAIELGSFAIRWYGILFSLGLIGGFFLMEWFFTREGKREQFVCFLPYGFVGALLGARLGHFLFYAPEMLVADPLVWIKLTTVKGMASHGAMFGLLLAFYFCSRRCRQLNFLWLCERGALTLLFIGFFIRIGNFLNLEILGKPTDSVWGVVVNQVDDLPRHPVQLYEAFAYLLLFGYFVRRYLRRIPEPGQLLWQTMLLMGLVRFMLEFVKEQQATQVFISGISNGQLLTVPIFIIAFFIYRYTQHTR